MSKPKTNKQRSARPVSNIDAHNAPGYSEFRSMVASLQLAEPYALHCGLYETRRLIQQAIEKCGFEFEQRVLAAKNIKRKKK